METSTKRCFFGGDGLVALSFYRKNEQARELRLTVAASQQPVIDAIKVMHEPKIFTAQRWAVVAGAKNGSREHTQPDDRGLHVALGSSIRSTGSMSMVKEPLQCFIELRMR